MKGQVQKIQELLSSGDFAENRLGITMMRWFTFSQCVDILDKTLLPTFLDYTLGTIRAQNIILLALFETNWYPPRILSKEDDIQWRKSIPPDLKSSFFNLIASRDTTLGNVKCTLWMEEVLDVKWTSGVFESFSIHKP